MGQVNASEEIQRRGRTELGWAQQSSIIAEEAGAAGRAVYFWWTVCVRPSRDGWPDW